MAGKLYAQINTRLSWWVMPCIWCLKVFCIVTGYKFDYDKLIKFLMRGVKQDVKVVTK